MDNGTDRNSFYNTLQRGFYAWRVTVLQSAYIFSSAFCAFCPRFWVFVMRELIPLWAHQREIATKAASRLDGYGLFLEQGTGKTATAITILRHKCYEAKRLLRTLIICPPVVRRSWQRELGVHSTIKKDLVHVLDGPGKKRLASFEQLAFENECAQPGIFITNYESLAMMNLFKLFKSWRPDVLILDESQRVKDVKARRTKLAIELADLVRYKLILTGTPILNTAMDIWSQFRILDGGATFDRNFYAFRARYFIDKNAGMPSRPGVQKFSDWRPIAGLEKVFNEKIYAKATRVLKKDCLDLPPLVKQRVEVELSEDQARMYKDMRDDYIAYLGNKACVASIALTKGLRLQQIVSGFWVDEEDKVHAFKKNPRREALKEMLAEITPNSKVIVWASFRHSYSDIISVCADLKIDCCHLYGGMTDKARQESIDSFQTDTKTRVMIANPAAGGVGVTLTAASFMIYFSRSFSLEHDLQSEARCHRGGSEIHDKITRIDIVAPDTIDELILEALERKENLAENILALADFL